MGMVSEYIGMWNEKIMSWLESNVLFSFRQVAEPETEGNGYYVPPAKGPSPVEVWAKNSQLPGDHVVAGSFDSAMRVSAAGNGFTGGMSSSVCILQPRS